MARQGRTTTSRSSHQCGVRCVVPTGIFYFRKSSPVLAQYRFAEQAVTVQKPFAIYRSTAANCKFTAEDMETRNGHQHDSVGGPPNRSSRLSRGRANLANTCLSIHYVNMRTGVNADQAFDIVCLTMRQDWGISRTERRINHRFRDNPATIVSSHGSIREGSKYLKNRSGNGTRSDGI